MCWFSPAWPVSSSFADRTAARPIFVALAVIAVVALAAAADVQVRGYLTVLIGLFLGYLALHTMINRLREWRAKSGAQGDDASNAESSARRRFLGLTLLLGAGATITAIASASCSTRRARCRKRALDSSCRERRKLPNRYHPGRISTCAA